MTAAQPSPAVPAHSINFVNEDNAWRIAFSLVEKVSDPGSADTNEHLHKFAAADRVKWDASFASDSFSYQGLSATWRSHQQHTSRDTGSQSQELLW